jgi:predicted NUDIX family phosphoesterase
MEKAVKAEKVLAVPTRVLHEAGLFQGFSPRVDHYLPRLLDPAHMLYLPRSQAEEDPSFKQIIPYAVLKHGEHVFHYLRGKQGSEQRLRALRSIGVGGHINPDDENLFNSTYEQGMLRELAEEVAIDTTFEQRCIGLINDDSTPVGQVHIGIVHLFELAEPKVRRREQVLTQTGFAPLRQLAQEREAFETWSQFVLEQLCTQAP